MPPPAGPPKSGSGAKVAIVVLLAAVVVVGGALLLSGGDDGSSPAGPGGAAEGGEDAGDPAQAVLDYLDAANAGDCDSLVQLLSQSSLALMGATDVSQAQGICQGMVSGGDELAGAGISVQSSEVVANDGTTASVEIVATADADTETTTIPVLNEGGSWKIDLSAMSASGSSPPPGGGGASGPDTTG